MTAPYGGSAKGEAETDNERARPDTARRLSSAAGKRSDERRARAFARSRDSAVLQASLDGNVVRATHFEKIVARPAKK